jgi:hypothetical protein
VTDVNGSSDHIPDGIEPLVGYRAWAYQLEGPNALLHPLNGTLTDAPNPWAGADAGWVVATCKYANLTLDNLDPRGRLIGEAIDISHVGHGRVPGERCTCGFYSMKTLPALEPMCRFVREWAMARGASGAILGRVDLAGKIIDHDFGYRAERARVAQVIPFEADLENGRRLARMLGVALGDPVAWGGPDVPTPDPTQPTSPPDGSSSVRRRVLDWVRDVAA